MFIFVVAKLEVGDWFASGNNAIVKAMSAFSVITQFWSTFTYSDAPRVVDFSL